MQTYEDFLIRYRYDPKKKTAPVNEKDFGLLGQGGFGMVYKGWDELQNRWVAIKIAPVDDNHPELSLHHEVKLARQLPMHPHIARYEECYRFTLANGDYDFAIMEYYRAGSLAQLMTVTSLSQSDAKEILVGILKGLRHLHGQGLIHRDLKPQNILIAEAPHETPGRVNYIPLITDFGLSRTLKEGGFFSTSVFVNSVAGGSLYYMAPEQVQGGTRMKYNVDLWAFGVIAYEILTGERPFKVDSTSPGSESARAAIVKKIIDGAIPPLIDQVQEPFQSAIRQCLVADIDLRIQSADLLLQMLSIPVGSEDVTNIKPSPKPPLVPPIEHPTPKPSIKKQIIKLKQELMDLEPKLESVNKILLRKERYRSLGFLSFPVGIVLAFSEIYAGLLLPFVGIWLLIDGYWNYSKYKKEKVSLTENIQKIKLQLFDLEYS